MERDNYQSLGVSAVIKERLMDLSDKTKVPVCDDCGLFALVNESGKIPICGVCNSTNISHSATPACEDCKSVNIVSKPRIIAICTSCKSKNVSYTYMPYSYKLLSQEMNAMGLALRLQLE